MLGAGLYWLLLPCTLLAGEWRARAGRLRPRTPAPRGCARASIGEQIPRDSRGPGRPHSRGVSALAASAGPARAPGGKPGRQRRGASPREPQIALGVSARAGRRGPGEGLLVSAMCGECEFLFSFVVMKKERKKKKSNLHHDFLTNLGEGGFLPGAFQVRNFLPELMFQP